MDYGRAKGERRERLDEKPSETGNEPKGNIGCIAAWKEMAYLITSEMSCEVQNIAVILGQKKKH